MSSATRPDRFLVLGLGNILCSDDGLGVAAIERLRQRYELPEQLQVLDGGTLGLALLAYFRDVEYVILVDAIRADEPPGSFVRLEGDEVAPAVRDRLSVHQIGVADLLDALRWLNAYPRRLVLLGLVPESLELSLERTPRVEANLPLLVEKLVEELDRLGCPVHRRRGSGKDPRASAIPSGRSGLLPGAYSVCPAD